MALADLGHAATQQLHPRLDPVGLDGSVPEDEPGRCRPLQGEQRQGVHCHAHPAARRMTTPIWSTDASGAGALMCNDRGGHWAAHDASDLLVGDLRQFFHKVW